jgi:glycosyltransferase involved in cell wall biosynthesis
MKILYVSPFFPPVIGGVESVLETTCKELTEQGHEVRVLTSPVKGVPLHEYVGRYLVQRSTLLQIPYNGIVSGDQFDFYRIANFIREITSDFEPDIVHFHNYQMRRYSMFLSAFVYGLDRKYPTLDTLHNDADDSFTHYTLTYTPLDRIVSVTSRAAMQLLSAGVSPERVSVVPNMINSQKFRAARGSRLRSKLGVRDDECLILFPSRIIGREGSLLLDATDGKGLTTLIQSLPEILEVDPTVKLLLLGNDTIFSEKMQETKMKLGRIVERIAGKNCLVFLNEDVPNSLLPEVFAASDIVASFGERETFGLVFLEGMAAGKPVVGVNSTFGGVAEAVPDGRAGYLVPPNDPHAIAKVISKLVVDEDLRKQLGLNGIKWVNGKFDAKIVLPKLLSLYHMTTRDIESDRVLPTTSTD